jgi:DNA-binding MarR family transcriptional regulator
MSGQQPLATLLSQVLVAFTIEFDNEFEHRMPHRTSRGPAAGTRGGPWLVSLAMWSNFLCHLDYRRDAAGAPLHDVDDLVRMTNLGGLERWGYLVITPPDDRPTAPRREHVVRPTDAALRAAAIWRPLAGEIEQRWQDRFDVRRLATALRALTSRFDRPLPRYLPVVNFGDGMRTHVPDVRRPYETDLSVQLSHALTVLTVEFEAAADVSLPVSANVLRVLDDSGVLVRDLPARSGVSKESIAAALGFLERHGYVVRQPVGRGRAVVLTPSGQRARAAYHELVARVETRWADRFGAATVGELRAALEPFAGMPFPQPYPDGWRAAIRRPTTLPHHPMVLHRGGYPDGA